MSTNGFGPSGLTTLYEAADFEKKRILSLMTPQETHLTSGDQEFSVPASSSSHEHKDLNRLHHLKALSSLKHSPQGSLYFPPLAGCAILNLEPLPLETQTQKGPQGWHQFLQVTK